MNLQVQLAKALASVTAVPFEEVQRPTKIPGLSLLRSDRPTRPSYRVFKPSFCIVAQGAKWALLGSERVIYGEGDALLVGISMPALGCVTQASPAKPYLGLLLEFDLDILHETSEVVTFRSTRIDNPVQSVYKTTLKEPVAACLLRLLSLLDMPEAIPALYPAIMRELSYWILIGPCGKQVADLAGAQMHTSQLIRSIHALRDRFAEPIRTQELASMANMSTSAFHRAFRAATFMSPLQYQKRLRLLEARRLLVVGSMNVERAARSVGYESLAQFSREYSRMFGSAPKRESLRIRQKEAATTSPWPVQQTG